MNLHDIQPSANDLIDAITDADSKRLYALASSILALAASKVAEEEREAIRQEIKGRKANSRHRYTKVEAIAVVDAREEMR